MTKNTIRLDYSHEYQVRAGGNQTYRWFRTDDLQEALARFDEWSKEGGLVTVWRTVDRLTIAEAQYGEVRSPDLREEVAQGKRPVPQEMAERAFKTARAPRELEVVDNRIVREVFNV